jgi:hypothetical protein
MRSLRRGSAGFCPARSERCRLSEHHAARTQTGDLTGVLCAGAADGGAGAPGGYARLATPSFTPGPGESPLMTWGDLDGTPLRLDQEDTPVDIGGRGAGPHFHMPEARSRWRICW